MTPDALSAATSPVPATIITGCLGAGKTTLLNNLLRQPHGRRFALLINEVSDLGIDDLLIERHDEEVVLLANGCICCTVRKDLVDGIRRMLQRGGFDYLLIETTGLASPGPIAQTFLNVPALSPYVRLDGIVTLVDLEQIERQLSELSVCVEQIAQADFIVLNKTDLVDAASISRTEALIARMNPHAAIIRSKQASVDLRAIVDVEAFDVDRIGSLTQHAAQAAAGNSHDLPQSVSVRLSGLFDAYRLQAFLEELSHRGGVFRSKGILAVAGSRRRAVFHGVNSRFTIYWDRPWHEQEERESRLVFIGRDLDAETLRRRSHACMLPQLSPKPVVSNCI